MGANKPNKFYCLQGIDSLRIEEYEHFPARKWTAEANKVVAKHL
jgi:hypothetical protein